MRIITGTWTTGIVLGANDGPVLIGAVITNDDTSAGSNLSALYGGADITADIRNLGTIGDATVKFGVNLVAGGAIINGAPNQMNATIQGASYGLRADAITSLTNFSSITGGFAGARLDGGGTVTNGSAADTTALISGGTGEGLSFGEFGDSVPESTLLNFGSIKSAAFVGVDLGGVHDTVTNGSSADTQALISGYGDGIRLIDGAGTINNFGTVKATVAGGIGLLGSYNGALNVTNGTPTSTAAVITGGFGINGSTLSVITNFGTVSGVGPSGEGVDLRGGIVVNGSAASTAAVIQGDFIGAYISKNPAAITNYAKISGGAAAILLQAGGTIINGSSADHTATIGTGIDGIDVDGTAPVSVTNYGIINGLVDAVLFGGGADRLTIEPGSQLIGAVDGGAGNDTVVFAGSGVLSLANFSHIEIVTLANATNSLALSDALVTSADDSHILTVIGGTGNDTINASAVTTTTDRVFITAGSGSDVLTGGLGADIFRFAAADLTSTDTVNGGGGTMADSIVSTTAGTIAAAAFTNVSHIEQVVLANGTNSLTLSNALVASADDSHVLHVIGGTGADTINASAVTTSTNRVVFLGGGGADALTAGAGADIFSYLGAADSTSTTYDTVTGFSFAADRFDIPGGAGTITQVEGARTGQLDSGVTFDTELAARFSTLGAHHAGLLTATSGTLSGQTFLVVDLNGSAGYQAGADLVLHLVSPTGTLAAGDFI